MFFVTILLNELLSWMRTQPGSSSLRSLFYMDEVFGYFPPTAKPPSKPPMLVLLKQARAFGLGITLATQNPVDLDYKGLSNIGTWFLGRLQTQRDKERVLEGLEGAAAQTGAKFDRSAMEETLAALGSRVFLMNNVHDDGPTIFQTRWAMSYLRGPLSRPQIQELMDPVRDELSLTEDIGVAEDSHQDDDTDATQRPILPNSVDELFLIPTRRSDRDSRLKYRPSLLARASCHYVRTSAGLDDWFDRTLLVTSKRSVPPDIWKDSVQLEVETLDLAREPEPEFGFAELPAEFMNAKNYKRWEKDLRDHIYRNMPMTLYECKELKAFSQPEQDELEARLAWKQQVRELRDEEKEELQTKYAKKVKSLQNKIRTAQQRVERETAQYDQSKWSSMLSIGQTVLGAFLGNKIASKSATAGRSIGRAAQQRTDVVHAKETLVDLQMEKEAMERELEEEVHELQSRFTIDSITLEPLRVPCRKGDLKVESLSLVWIPWEIDRDGIARPLAILPKSKSGRDV